MNTIKHNWKTISVVLFLAAILLVAVGLLLSTWIQGGTFGSLARSSDLPDNMVTPAPGAQTLIVGGDDSYPPYSYLEDGIAKGFDNDLMREVAAVMGVNIEFKLTSWAEAKQNLLDNKVDIIGGMAFSDERAAIYDFSNPYSVHYSDLFVRSNSNIKSMDEIEDKQVVVQEGDIMQDYLKNRGFSGEIIAAQNPAEALMWVSSGKYDGAFLNTIIGYFYINSNRLSNLHSLNLQLLERNYGIAVQKGNEQLLKQLNEALAIVSATGQYDRLTREWFSIYDRQSVFDQFRFYLYGLVALSALFGLVILWGWSLRRQVRGRTRELWASETKYRQLIDSATEGVYVVAKRKILYLNPQAIKILGMTGTPIYPMDIRVFIHPDDYEMVDSAFLPGKEQETEPISFVHRIVKQNGDMRWVKSNTRNIIWESSPAFLGFFADITDARNLEESVKESERKYRLLFSKTPVGLFYFNSDLVVTNFNDRFAQILRADNQSLENLDLTQLADNRIKPALQAVLEHEEGYYEGAYQPLNSETGKDLFINLHTTPIFNEKRDLQGGIGLIEDITDVVVSESKLQNLEDRFTKAFKTSPDSININRLSDGVYFDVNDGFTNLTGFTPEDVIGKSSLDINIWANPDDRARVVSGLLANGEIKNLEASFRMKNGNIRTGLISAALIDVNGEKCIISITRDISDRKKAEDGLRASEIRYRTIFESVPVSIWEQDFLQAYDMLEALRATGVKDLQEYIDQNPDFLWPVLKSIVVKDVNDYTIRMFEAQTKEDLLGSIDQLFDRESYKHFDKELLALWDHKRIYEGEIFNRTLDGKKMIVRVMVRFPERREDYSSVIVSLADITQQKQAETALKESENRYKSIFNSVPVSIWEEDFTQVMDLMNDLKENGVKDLDLYLKQHPQVVREAANLIVINEVNDATLAMYGAKTKSDLMQNHDRVFTEQSYDNFRRELIAFWNKSHHFYGETTSRTLDGKEIMISLSTNIPQESEGYSRVFISIEDISERKKAEDQVRRQVKHLASLRAVDMAISASIDLPITLRVLINQAVQQLAVDAASILLFNPQTQLLEFAAGSGFITHAIENTRLKLGESYAGKAALERRIVVAGDLSSINSKLLTANLSKENFTDYLGVPLIAKGAVKGVLELFNRSQLPSDTEWMSLLDSMAGQAAIAIDNATLFDEVQQANINLRRAYEATIEGWARALELRDGETEGHSARVADMTVNLAEMLSIKGEDLVNIRRGALLHDIGKMGIPDHILLKQGELTVEEWETMRKHPVYAKSMLESIEFLQEAIDIPYTHHEKWDGSGYPQGLTGENIPLAGRVFAVVDCWDALRSDRPYRKAWSTPETWKFIELNAGKEYDPNVVAKFRQLLESLNYLKG